MSLRSCGYFCFPASNPENEGGGFDCTHAVGLHSGLDGEAVACVTCELDHSEILIERLRQKNVLIAQMQQEPIARIVEAINDLSAEVHQVRTGLVVGRFNIRTHHPMCSTPPAGDYTIEQLEAMARFVSKAIETGALLLPPKAKEARHE